MPNDTVEPTLKAKSEKAVRKFTKAEEVVLESLIARILESRLPQAQEANVKSLTPEDSEGFKDPSGSDSPIFNAVDVLDARINNLHALLDALFKRLERVCRNPNAATAMCKEEDPDYESELHHTMLTLASRVDSANGRLRYLLDTLTL